MSKQAARGKHDHLTLEEQNDLLQSFQSKMKISFAAARVGCSTRVTQKYYSMFQSGWRPGKVNTITKTRSETAYVGPVEKRQTPRPNCLPGLESKIRGPR